MAALLPGEHTWRCHSSFLSIFKSWETPHQLRIFLKFVTPYAFLFTNLQIPVTTSYFGGKVLLQSHYNYFNFFPHRIYSVTYGKINLGNIGLNSFDQISVLQDFSEPLIC